MLRTSSKRRLLGVASGIVLIFLAIDTNGQTLPGGSNPPLANGTVKGIAAGDGVTITCTAGICVASNGGTAGIGQLTGDVTAGPGSGSQVATIAAGAVTLAKMANLPANSIIINNTGSAAVPASAALPACADSGGNHLNYASGAFSCGTSSSGGSSAFASLTSGTNTTAAMLVGTGASLGPTASGTVTANAVSNGTVALAGMANLAANSIIGNNTGSPAAPIALTAAQVKTLLAIAPSDLSGLGTGVATALGSAVSGTGAICLASGSSCSGAAGVSSITSGTPALTFNASTGAVTANLTVPNNTQAIASYTIAASDNTKVVNRTYTTAPMTDTLPNVSTTGFGAGYATTLAVNSSQPDTLTVTAPSTINGVSSITIPAHAIVNIADPDGLNYIAEIIQDPSNVAITGGSIDGTAIGITTPAAAKVTNLTVTGTCTGCTGSGAVNSVSNSDGSLTVSPTTGAVVASLPAGSVVAQKRSLIYNLACTTYAKSAVVTGTTSETVVASCTIPANLLGVNGGLVFETIAGRNSGGTSSLTFKYYFNSSAAAGGMQIGSTQTLGTTSLSLYNHYEFGNRGATNSQVAFAASLVGNSTTVAVNTGTIDTTAASDIVITCTPGNTGDSCWTEMMSVKFVPAGGN